MQLYASRRICIQTWDSKLSGIVTFAVHCAQRKKFNRQTEEDTRSTEFGRFAFGNIVFDREQSLYHYLYIVMTDMSSLFTCNLQRKIQAKGLYNELCSVAICVSFMTFIPLCYSFDIRTSYSL